MPKKEKKKVLYLIERSAIGGVETQLLTLLKNIDRKKYETHVIVTDINWVYNSEIKDNCDHFKSLMNFDSQIKKELYIAVPPSVEKLDEINVYIKSNAIDIVHLFNGLQYLFCVPEQVPFMMHLGGDFRRPTYYDLVNVEDEIPTPKARTREYWESVIKARIRKVMDLLNGRSNYNILTDNIDNVELFGNNCHVYNNWIDIKPTNHKKEKNTIIWVGRNSPEKRPEMVLNLAVRLPEFRFIIVISGDYYNPPYLQDLPNNIELYSQLSDRKKLAELYSRSEMFLLTSTAEGLPLAFLEAISCGCYPICSEVGMLNNENFKIGSFISKHDNQANFTRKIREFSRSTDKKNISQRLKDKGKEFHMKNRIEDIYLHYDSLLGVSRPVEIKVEKKEGLPSWFDDLDKVLPNFQKFKKYYSALFTTLPRMEAIRTIFEFNGLSIPKISIVMPTWNRGWCIENAIRSIFVEEYPNLELLVIDKNNSKDTGKICKKIKKEGHNLIFESKKYNGNTPGEQLNRGLKLSTGDYAGYLGDDDLHEEGGYTLLSLYLAQHPETYAVFSNYKILDTRNNNTVTSKFKGTPDFNRLVKGNYVGGNSLLHKNNGFVKFNPKDPYGEDWDQWLRIGAKYGWKYVPVMSGTVIVGHKVRMGEQSIETDLWKKQFKHHQKLAKKKYSKLREGNLSDLHIAIFSYSYGRKPFGGSANNHWNVVDCLTTLGLDVTIITVDPKEVYYKNEKHPHNIMSIDEFFSRDWKDEYNVFHVFAYQDSLNELNRNGIRPICGSNIVTNCGLEELVFCSHIPTTEKWETIRHNDELFMATHDAMFWVAQSKFQEFTYKHLCKYKGKTFRFNNTIDCYENYKFVDMDDRPKNTVLWTGSVAPLKGPEDLNKLARLLPTTTFIACTETDIDITEPNIIPVMGLGMDDMRDMYRMASVLVTTTYCENQPLGVIEGMATGLPAIGYEEFKTPHGLSEVIIDGKNGYLTPFRDTKKMAKKIRYLLNNHDKRRTLGQNAREFAVKNFDYKNAGMQFVKLYFKYLDMCLEDI